MRVGTPDCLACSRAKLFGTVYLEHAAPSDLFWQLNIPSLGVPRRILIAMCSNLVAQCDKDPASARVELLGRLYPMLQSLVTRGVDEARFTHTISVGGVDNYVNQVSNTRNRQKLPERFVECVVSLCVVLQLVTIACCLQLQMPHVFGGVVECLFSLLGL